MSRTWVIPRGAFMYVIGMSGAAEGDDVSEAEFAAAVKSVEIQR